MRFQMSTGALRAVAATSFLAVALVTVGSPRLAAQPAGTGFAAHRAIYDLKLAQLRGGKQLSSVRGRILYDFNGSACEGYTLQFRQVTELDSGEGKNVVSDLRSNTFEDGPGTLFRFASQNYVDQQLKETVEGTAERGDAKVTVALRKPQGKQFEIELARFPTEQMRLIVQAAKEGRTLLELPVYDGSETGEKIYSTLTVIGQPVAPEKKPADAAGNEPALAGMARWPVTISYFDKSTQGGEQTPVYALSFELYENGISRALSLDYGDFVLAGDLTSLQMKKTAPCP